MKRVLIVDDNDDSRTLMAEALRMDGYEVLEARGGREALEMLQHVDPAAVVLDLMMPDMSGQEVLATLRRSGRLEKLRVIVLTGSSAISTCRARTSCYPSPSRYTSS
jgi:CheY-like chemotaxis protein